MFGNRGFGLKLGAGLAVAAAFAAYSGWRGAGVKPAPWRCVAEPDKWDGRTLWVPSACVLWVRPDAFGVVAQDVPLTVRGSGVSEGDQIEFLGTFRASGPRVDLVRARVLPPHARLRWVVEVVSLAVLAFVLLNFVRHFRYRPGALQGRGS